MSCSSNVVDFTIIGAGPAGIQWGLLLHQWKKYTYVILEKNNRPGSFFQDYPRARTLISHNKCNLGNVSDEFRLRHDWHSLLEAPLKFCDMYTRFYPQADEYVDYLSAISKNLNIQYYSEVFNIEYTKTHVNTFTISKCIQSKYVILSTGLNIKPSRYTLDYSNFPNLDKNMEASFCKNKKIGILGGGNAGFETANMLKTCARSVHVFTKKNNFASLTHYPGGLRLQHGELFDRYFLKSLDSVEITNTFNEITHCSDPNDCYKNKVDFVIYCGGFTGFRPSIITNMSAQSNFRFPASGEFYSILNSNNRGWYAGVLMHEHDYKKSSGGFVHGFRYLIKSQLKFIHATETGIWDTSIVTNDINHIVQNTILRVQESSGLYQMQGMLVDVICKFTNGYFAYLKEIPHIWINSVLNVLKDFNYTSENTKNLILKDYCILKLEYGDIKEWNFELAVTNGYANSFPPQFLHPTIEHSDGTKWIGYEDLDGEWSSHVHMSQISKNINSCLYH